MTIRNTDNDHRTEGLSEIEDQLKSVRSSAPPADLLGKLQADLGNAIEDQSWDDSNQWVEPAASPTPSRWWHSPSMRIAAALLMVVGAGWYFSRAQMPPILVEARPSVSSESDSGSITAGSQDLDADLSRLDANLEPHQLPELQRGARQSNALAEEKRATDPQELREETSTDRPSPPLAPVRKGRLAKQSRAISEQESAIAERDGRSRMEPPTLRSAQAIGSTGDTKDDKVEGQSKAKKEQVTVTSEAPMLDATSLGSDEGPASEAVQGQPVGSVSSFRDPAPAPAAPPAPQPTALPRRAQTDKVEEARTRPSPTTAKVSEPSDRSLVERSKNRNTGGTEIGQGAVFASTADGEHEKIFAASTREAAADRYDDETDQRKRLPRRPLRQFDAMYFRDYGISQFVDPQRDAESTFGLETDTGSYSIAREYLNRGVLPPAAAVRVEEFLNAFNYGDAAPSARDFAISVEGGTTPYETQGRSTEPRQNGDRAWLRIGVKAREISAAQRNPTSLTFLVDTSGSMAQENRIEIVRESLRLLVNELEPDDSVAIVTYGSRGHVLLDHTSDRAAILRMIERLHPNGSTNLQEGMEYAYRIASEELRRTEGRLSNDRGDSIRRRANRATNHRVLLLSDGVANVGLTDAEELLRNVAQWAARGIELTSVGVGMGNYNDELLERLADRGDGRYAYVDRMEEARRLFVENLTGTLQTVGADARVQVTFDPKVVRQYRLLGYENRDIPDAAFRDKRTDGGEIGAGHTVTALYELVIDPSARRRSELGSVALVYRPNGKSELTEQTRSIRVDTVTSAVSEASPALRLATLTGRFAELLRVSPHVEGDLSDLFLEAQQLIPEFPGDRRVVELADMIGKARDLMLQRD